MSRPPQLFDRTAILRHRKRADHDALFLQKLAADEIKDRLTLVNRSFRSMAVVSGFPNYWKNVFPEAISVADDEFIELESGRYDLVVHAMSLHWSNDPIGQVIQCRRALVPDGLFLGISLGGGTLNELRSSLATAETEITNGVSPRVSPMAEIREMGAILQRSGLALPVADSFSINASYRDFDHLLHDLRNSGESNALEARLRKPTRRALFSRANEIYQSLFSNSDQSIKATFEFICLTGWAPDGTQPTPLRPGSAQARLADALGTNESKLSD